MKEINREIERCIDQSKIGSISDAWIAKKQFAIARQMKRLNDPGCRVWNICTGVYIERQKILKRMLNTKKGVI